MCTGNRLATGMEKASLQQMRETKLPCKWVVYLYNKSVFKKQRGKTGLKEKPHKAVCTLSTLNDLVYFLQLMEAPAPGPNKQEINLDANDYIIMREGIEPIWEDPKNKDGGQFTMKVIHDRGYEIWSLLTAHMVGETLTDEMSSINGISSAFMYDVYNTSGGLTHTYIKIWDSKPNRDKDSFLNILQPSVVEKIIDTSLQYLPNSQKKHFGQKPLLKYNDRRNYGGFKRK